MSRRGRKRRVMVKRRPCGEVVQRSAVEREREIRATGIAARERVYGLPHGKASKPEAGTAFGRAYLGGELSPNDAAHNEELYEAGLEFERRRRAYLRAIAAIGIASAGDLERIHGNTGEESQTLVVARQHAMRRYDEIRGAILDCGQPLAMFALESWILDDRPMSIGDLRFGLNAVWRVIHMQRQVAA